MHVLELNLFESTITKLLQKYNIFVRCYYIILHGHTVSVAKILNLVYLLDLQNR